MELKKRDEAVSSAGADGKTTANARGTAVDDAAYEELAEQNAALEVRRVIRLSRLCRRDRIVRHGLKLHRQRATRRRAHSHPPPRRVAPALATPAQERNAALEARNAALEAELAAAHNENKLMAEHLKDALTSAAKLQGRG